MKYLSFNLLAAAVLGILITGCASTHPVPYSGVKSSPLLAPNTRDHAGRIPYAYSGKADWQKYKCVVVDPVVVYDGPDNQFENIPDEEKQLLAKYMREEFCQTLRAHYELIDFPAPDTLRIKLTLSGAKPSVPGLSTFTRVDMSGGVYNLVQSVRGKEGAFTGWVSFAVEVTDADTDQPLSAYVEKQYPNAINILATLGKWDAAKTGIHKGAEDLVERLK